MWMQQFSNTNVFAPICVLGVKKEKLLVLKLCGITVKAKAWGLRQTLMWLLNLCFTWVVIELDNKLVLDDISSKLGHMSEFGSILSACKNLFFPYYKVWSNKWRGFTKNNLIHCIPKSQMMPKLLQPKSNGPLFTYDCNRKYIHSSRVAEFCTKPGYLSKQFDS